MNWASYLLGMIVLAGAVYTVIPDLFLHRLGWGSWKRQYSPGVVLSFDDGPNPGVTPQVLDILDTFGVKAVFFVTGVNALRYPELIKEILRRGHRIGTHSFNHRYAWFTSPFKTWQEWEKGVQAIESLTGQPVEWFRPPWGTFNLVTWLWMKTRRKRAVLWNVEGRDWKTGRGWQEVARQVVSRVDEGAIVVLHDAGGQEGAPLQMLDALPAICRSILKEKKLPLVGLDFPDWPWHRRMIFRLFEKWEHFFARIYRVERINATNFFRVAKTVYKGPPLFAEDGGLLARAGDTVGEIHFHSGRLQGGSSNIREQAVRVLRLAKQSLPELAKFVTENPEYKDVQVFLGLTLINRGVKGLGFSVRDVPVKSFERGVYFLQKLIRWVYLPEREMRSRKSAAGPPKLVWISRQTLLERWLPTGQKDSGQL